MQNNPCFRVVLLLVTIFPSAHDAMAKSPGDGGIEVSVDGPDEVQPGNDRRLPDPAVDPKGRSIFVWVAFANATRGDIFLCRFDSSGNALDDPIAVNTLVEDDQLSPRLAVSENGSFLVIWQSDEPDAAAGGVIRRWIRGQAFDADAKPVEPERLISADGAPNGDGFVANSSIGSSEFNNAVTELDDGGFFAVWRAGTDLWGNSIRPQIQVRGQ